MELKDIKELMRNGDLEEASSALSRRLAENPEDVASKVLYGICCRLRGDEASFIQIDRELANTPKAKGEPKVAKYHALKAAACAAALTIAASVAATANAASLYGISYDCTRNYTAHVLFDAGGGRGSMVSRAVSVNFCKANSYVLPRCSFTRSGYVFSGWTIDNLCWDDYPSDEFLPAGSQVDLSGYINDSGCQTCRLTAHWVLAEDDHLAISPERETIEIDVGEWVDSWREAYFTVDSGSSYTLSATGLPPGVKFNSKTSCFSGSPSRRGRYYTIVTAKNDGKFQHSAVLVWNVGQMPLPDYDGIGIGDSFPDEFLKGESVDFCLNANLKSMTGLPTGLKFKAGSLCSGGSCTACSDFVSGMPTKPGAYTVTITDRYNRKMVKTVLVKDIGSRRVPVESISDWKGTVSGGGVYAAGSTVRIAARAKSGYYFAGWYRDRACTEEFWGGKSGDYRTASESFVFDTEMTREDVSLFAKFVSKYEDGHIDIDCSDTWEVCTYCGEDRFWFDVESETKPKVTAKGLPSGVKLSGSELVIADTSKLKPGTSIVTLTAKNLSGAIAENRVKVVVPNLESWVFGDLNYEPEAYKLKAGLSDSCCDSWLFSEVEAGWKVTASGLPAGLKLQQWDDGWRNSISLRGTPTKPGTYTVTLTAKRGAQTQVATVSVVVEPMPPWAVGTYAGWCRVDGQDGMATFTVSSVGKMSGKLTVAGKNYSLLSGSYGNCESENEYFYYPTFKKDGRLCQLEMRIHPVAPCRKPSDGHDGGRVEMSTAWNEGPKVEGCLFQNFYMRTDGTLPTLQSGYEMILDHWNTDSDLLGYSDVLKLRIGSKGTLNISGKIDGVSVSGSSTLTTDGFYGLSLYVGRATIALPKKTCCREGFYATAIISLELDPKGKYVYGYMIDLEELDYEGM